MLRRRTSRWHPRLNLFADRLHAEHSFMDIRFRLRTVEKTKGSGDGSTRGAASEMGIVMIAH